MSGKSSMVSATEAATLEGVARQTIVRRIKSSANPLPATINTSGHWRIRVADLRAWTPAKPGPKGKGK